MVYLWTKKKEYSVISSINSCLFYFAGGVVNVNGLKLSPRIVLMTDGKPTSTTEVQVKTNNGCFKTGPAISLLFLLNAFLKVTSMMSDILKICQRSL